MVQDIKVEDPQWEPPPVFKNLPMKKLLSYVLDKADLSIVIVNAEKGIDRSLISER